METNSKREQMKNKKINGTKADVSKSFFAVVHKDHTNNHSVLLLGDTKEKAIRLWEKWNDETRFDLNAEREGWSIRKYKAKYVR